MQRYLCSLNSVKHQTVLIWILIKEKESLIKFFVGQHCQIISAQQIDWVVQKYMVNI